MSKILNDNLEKRRVEARNIYLVTIEFENRCLGGQPSDPVMLRKWIEGKLEKAAALAEKKAVEFPSPEQRAAIVDDQVKRLVDSTPEDLVDDEEKKNLCIHWADDHGLYVGSYQLKAGFREMAMSLGITVAKSGAKQTIQALISIRALDADNNIIWGPEGDRCYFGRRMDPVTHRAIEPITEADGILERPIAITDAKGTRTAISANQHVDRAFLSFGVVEHCDIRDSRKTAVIRDPEVVDILAGMEGNGIGACRTQGFGKFRVAHLERLTEQPFMRGTKKEVKAKK